MSLVDFDDDASFHSASAPTASFNGHNSIDDPFGFNVFGTGSSGTKQTTTVTESVFTGSNDKFFDDFDPLAGFGDASDKHEGTHTTHVVTTTITTSDTRPKGGDQFDPFGDFAPNGSSGGDANQVTSFESTRQSWVDDDFRTSDQKDAPDLNDAPVHDLDHSSSSQTKDTTDEKSGVVIPDSSPILKNTDDMFWTSQPTSLGPSAMEQDTPASPHSDGVFPHSSTDAIDEILGDLHEETAPRAEMEDLSPVKLTYDKTSPDRLESAIDSQFHFDRLSESRKSDTAEAVKPGNEYLHEASPDDVVPVGDNLIRTSAEMEDFGMELNGVKEEELAANSNTLSSEVDADDLKTAGNIAVNIVSADDSFLAENSVPTMSSLGNVSAQENFDFSDVTSNPFVSGNFAAREDSLGDLDTQVNLELSTGPAGNTFLSENFVRREDSLEDFSAEKNFEFHAVAASDPFFSGDSVPREGSPGLKNDVDERETLHQFVEEVRIEEEHSSVLDDDISKAETPMVSELKASYEPEIDFRSKEREQRATTAPETVYNKMYNYRQDNSWRQTKEMDVQESAPIQFQISSRKRDEPEKEEVQQNNYKAEEEEVEEDEDESQMSSDQFFEDVKDRSRGRIGIEEIRQRSYEDFGPVSSSSSHNRKEQKPAEKQTPVVYVLGSAGDNICKVCSKRVYEMEKVTADLQVYHKTCFRCHHCNRVLSLGNFSTNEGQLYCKPHFIEIFKTKGNYKDSFAHAEQQKQRGDNGRGDDASSQDQSDTDNQRSRGTSSGYQEDDEPERDYDDYEEEERRQRSLKEEIPTVPIKSVRNIFEKMSQDNNVAPPVHQQKKPTAKASSAAVHVETVQKRNPEATTERVRNDSEKSDLEIDRNKLLERRDSTSEVVQSSTTCIVEDELPPPAFTRSLLAKFKMMENNSQGGSGNKAPVVYGAPASAAAKQTTQTAQRHQTLSHRSSNDSRASNDPVAEEVPVGRDAPDSAVRRSASQERKEEDRTDELPQAGLAKSLLAQWRNLEEQSKRGRSREPRSSASARRSQSMSRVETVQRARLYPVQSSAARSKQVEDIRPGDYSDQEASGDEQPAGAPTKQRLAVFQGFEGYGAASSAAPKRTFKWEVKEPLPMNRGVLIVHGDVPKKPSPEEAAAASASAARWSDSANEYAAEPEHRRSATDDDDGYEANRVPDDVIHGSTTTVIIEDELPAPATTRNLLQHFKSMEDVTKAPPRPRVASTNRDPTPKTTKPAAVYANDEEDDYEPPRSKSSVNGDENDYTQYGASPDAGEFANDPVRDPSVIRESDRCDEEELPAQGTTKSLLAKFQSFQGKH